MEHHIHIIQWELSKRHNLLAAKDAVLTPIQVKIAKDAIRPMKKSNNRYDIVNTMCDQPMVRGDTRPGGSDDVTCPLCLVEWQRQQSNPSANGVATQ